jgi:group I intron endonuclease
MKFINENIEKDNHGIYAIRNTVNDKYYIGQTIIAFIKRYWKHNWQLECGTHFNQELQDDWLKYGNTAFEFIILEVNEDTSRINEREKFYISKYKAEGKAYNVSEGGSIRYSTPMSDHTKKLIGEKNRINMLGKKHAESTKAKMSAIRKGHHIPRKTDRLDKETVIKIKNMLIEGVSASKVSKELNVDYRLINNMMSNNTWDSIKVDGWDDFRKNRKTYQRLTKDDHKNIYKLHVESNISKKELAKKYGKTESMIRKIIRDQKKLYDNPVPSR